MKFKDLYMPTSKRFRLNKQDGLHILKVLGYTVASAAIAALLSLVNAIEFPTELVWLVPAINVALVSLKKFVTDQH